MNKIFSFFQTFYLTGFFTWKSLILSWTVWSIAAFIISLYFIFFIKFTYIEFFIISFVLFLLSIPIINNYEYKNKTHDSKIIVIDEFVWVFLTTWIILYFSENIYLLSLWLIFFRFFDMFKPSIIWFIDNKIKWWLWVMLDDIIAAIFAWLIVVIIYYLWSYWEVYLKIFISIVVSIITIYITNYLVKSEKIKLIIKKNIYFQANAISYYRMPLSLFSVLIFVFFNELIWLAIYVFSVVTDYSDWVIARSCNLESEKWKSLDPFSDKVTYFIPLFYFAFIWKIALFLVIIFFIIDFLWQFSRILLKKLKKETKANYFWKIKTSFVFILIFLLMIKDDNFIVYLNFNLLLIFSIIFAILSIVFKFYDFKNLINISNKNICK